MLKKHDQAAVLTAPRPEFRPIMIISASQFSLQITAMWHLVWLTRTGLFVAPGEETFWPEASLQDGSSSLWCCFVTFFHLITSSNKTEGFVFAYVRSMTQLINVWSWSGFWINTQTWTWLKQLHVLKQNMKKLRQRRNARLPVWVRLWRFNSNKFRSFKRFPTVSTSNSEFRLFFSCFLVV